MHELLHQKADARNVAVVLDAPGSMGKENKVATARKLLQTLLSPLGPANRVAPAQFSEVDLGEYTVLPSAPCLGFAPVAGRPSSGLLQIKTPGYIAAGRYRYPHGSRRFLGRSHSQHGSGSVLRFSSNVCQAAALGSPEPPMPTRWRP